MCKLIIFSLKLFYKVPILNPIIKLMQSMEHNKSEMLSSQKVRKEEIMDKKNRMPTERHEGENACGQIGKIAKILEKPIQQRNGQENSLISRFIEQNIYLKGITSKVSKEFTKNLMKKAKIQKIGRNKVLGKQGEEISEVGIIIEGKVNVYKRLSEEIHGEINKDDIWHELLNKSAKQIKEYKIKSKITKSQPIKIYEDVASSSQLIQTSSLEFKICQNEDYGMEDLALGSHYLRSFVTDEECTIVIIKEEDLIIYLQQALKDKIKALTAQMKSIKCFSFLESDKINPIIQHLSMHKIKRGQRIYSQGDEVTEFYLLMDGEIRLNKSTNLFEENPNQLYFSRTKLVEETLFKNQKKSEMNKQESQIFERKIKRSILPYANLKNMYNYQPVQKNIEIATMASFCFFGEEQFLENKRREASAICSSLDCDYYSMKIKKIQEILGNKLWPSFKKRLKDSVSKKVLYRQSQYASNLQFQNKTHMNYFYIDQEQQPESPRKFKIQKFNNLLQPAKRLITPQKVFTRQGQRKSVDEFPIATPPRYTAFNFNKLMKKPEEVQKTDDEQAQFQYKDEKQLRIMNVSHTWRLMKQKVDFQLRASRKISPIKQVILVIQRSHQSRQNIFTMWIDRKKESIESIGKGFYHQDEASKYEKVPISQLENDIYKNYQPKQQNYRNNPNLQSMIRKFSINHFKKYSMDLSKYAYASKKKEVVDDSMSKIQSVNSTLAATNSIKSKSKITKKNVKLQIDPIETLNIITKWRNDHEAPVDVVGCERLYDRSEPEFIQKYQLLVSVFLSVQTKDEITSKVVKRLIDYGLTPDNILKTSVEDLRQLIQEVNFNKKKSQRLLQITKTIKSKGQMPKTLEEVTAFPGIGLKIANIYLKTAEGVITGVGVDTHVHRISNKLGWVDTKSPNNTEEQLQKVFPKELWAGMNIALVGFGQLICDAKKPKCSQCCVKNRCPSYSF